VTRRVTVTGNPATMPVIDANDASRAFRVKVRVSCANPITGSTTKQLISHNNLFVSRHHYFLILHISLGGIWRSAMSS